MSVSTEKKDTVSKIDAFLKAKGATPTKSYKSFIPLRKLMECQWGDEKEMREVALDCMREMMEHDDDMAKEFMKRLFSESGLIGQSVIKMYMVNNSIDSLPLR